MQNRNSAPSWAPEPHTCPAGAHCSVLVVTLPAQGKRWGQERPELRKVERFVPYGLFQGGPTKGVQVELTEVVGGKGGRPQGGGDNRGTECRGWGQQGQIRGVLAGQCSLIGTDPGLSFPQNDTPSVLNGTKMSPDQDNEVDCVINW